MTISNFDELPLRMCGQMQKCQLLRRMLQARDVTTMLRRHLSGGRPSHFWVMRHVFMSVLPGMLIIMGVENRGAGGRISLFPLQSFLISAREGGKVEFFVLF